jgi:glutaredoxin 3
MRDVTIYTKAWCPYCQDAKALLKRKGVDFTEIELDRQPERRAEMLERSGGRRTVPQVFIGATHVGGCDDLYALDEEGGLDPLLAVKSEVTKAAP